MAQVVEHLPSKHEALSLNPVPPPKIFFSEAGCGGACLQS
jgi:hypothetical protein